MADEKYTFEQARVRLEEIVAQVRRKDVSLETSIDLLEEGVRLANMCTELSDHTEWRTVAEEQEAARDDESGDGEETAEEASDEHAEPDADDAEPADEPPSEEGSDADDTE